MIKDIFKLVESQFLAESSAMLAIEQFQTHLQDQREYIALQETFSFDEPYVRDHRVFGERLLLGVTHCSLAINAFLKVFPADMLGGLGYVRFINPVRIAPATQVSTRIMLQAMERLQFIAQFSAQSSPWAATASGDIKLGKNHPYSIQLPGAGDVAQQEWQGADIYAQLDQIVYGDALFSIDQIAHYRDQSIAHLSLKRSALDELRHYHCHPALLDGAMLCALSPYLLGPEKKAFIPFFIESITWVAPPDDNIICRASITQEGDEIVKCDFTLCNAEGQVFVDVKGFTCKYVRDVQTLLNSIQTAQMQSTLHQQPQPSARGPVAASHQNLVRNITNLDSLVKQFVVDVLKAAHPNSTGDLPDDRNFMELGFDSATLVGVATTLESALGIELYPTTFFEYQNIQELTQFLLAEHGQALSNYFAAGIITDSVEEKRVESIMIETPVAPQPVTQGKTNMASAAYEEIAVIGMAGVFAESDNVHEFWQHLHQGTNLMAEIPRSRFDYRPWFDETGEKDNGIYCTWGSFIRDVDKFDAEFFNIGLREAEVMDPQLRKLLQVTYLTAEDAGYATRIRGSNTGVFVGCCFYDYQAEMLAQGKPIEVYDGIGNSPTMLANRQSYFYDLRGPSLTVDTACSSSLVALHLACQALQRRECEQAFVSGANLLLTPGHYQYFCRIGALGRTGRCHSFDEQADGYIPGEGIASVLLKPLDSALRDGDRIYGVIKSSAIKHGGYASSVTAPNVKGEQEVIVSAWQQAQIDPSTIDYIEAHGTGTALGDPIEFQATEKAFKQFTTGTSFCAIGSAKAHIGHLEGAAGIAGLIKVLLSMKHKTIPAMPAFNGLNPYIKLANSPLYINGQSIPWPERGHRRRAGVNSFGFGGTFAHIVVEEFDNGIDASPHQTTGPQLMVLSAKNAVQLTEKCRDLHHWLQHHALAPEQLIKIAYTLQTAREPMDSRIAFLANDMGDLLQKLESICAGEKLHHVWQGEVNPTALTTIFNGDGQLSALMQNYIQGTPNLNHLAQLWVQGLAIDWSLMYGAQKIPLIDLPGHNFVRRSYWFKPLATHSRSELVNSTHKKIIELQKECSEKPDRKAEQAAQLALESIAYRHALYALRNLGLFQLLEKNPLALSALRNALQILPKYEKLLLALLNLLRENSVLSISKGKYKLNPDVQADWDTVIPNHLDGVGEDVIVQFPALEPHVTLMAQCVASLPQCMKGEKLATEVLFAESSFKLVENIYTNNSIAVRANENMASFLALYVSELRKDMAQDKKLRIIEIGAGTGGTTRHLLNALVPHGDVVEYFHTDISPAFLQYAEENFSGQYPFLKTALLDIENLTRFANSPQQADIVIASNVLHATHSMHNTLQNVRGLLGEQGGTVLINELTRPQTFLTLTFGLLDGWWQYDDEELRVPFSPLLDRASWLSSLANFDCANVLFDEDEGQEIFVAHTDKSFLLGRPVLDEPIRMETQAVEPVNPVFIVESDMEISNIIKQQIAKMLHQVPAAIDDHTYFMDLGLDSLKAVELQEKLNRTFNLKLSAIALLNYPNTAQLSLYISELLKGEIPEQKLQHDQEKFSRYNADEKLADELRHQKQLKGKTQIDKLFQVPERIAESPVGQPLSQYFDSNRLRSVLPADKISIEALKTSAGILELVCAGKGKETILLLSPLNTLAVVWHNQFEQWAKHFQVVCCHYPGFGKSDFMAEGFSLDKVADAIITALDSKKITHPCHLVGWSMGGLIGQSIAERFAARVQSLTLIGTGTISMFDDDYYNDHTHIQEILDLELNGSTKVHPVLKADHDLLVGTYNTEVLMHYAQIIRDFDHKRRRRINAPVLVMNGSDDKVLLPQYAKELCECIAEATYLEIPQAGHFMVLTHPAKIDKHLRRFWKSAQQKQKIDVVATE
ncbi:L-histidine N(alpha)-methyltransferase [Cellvibrio japonicus]|uniref:MmpIV n=1 Tax=Cellvibrio japonicus (strain Ueda107) TaxID=498211 RepID=B3PCT9_CELJU|nr:L-histidine N(alpha)-methyltransferase [Cellvibrio japonicus]ACE85786.1 MmpIV [Cellvibrio japonicus Ueda107]QEI13308.1 alpha/beta fold hydrolase [Cellvibrio japonicus]QEI16882.1 alpha/beta fold hydrolase [Cellvibrio japonicus]QEI20460.1 alpha/beta fold hydrolase [Cellvibrio japonicus]